MSANSKSALAHPTFSPELLRRIADAREPLTTMMAALRVWRVAVETSDGEIESGDATKLQCALIVVNQTLDAHKDALCEAPSVDWLIGHSLVRMLEDALWNIAGQTSGGSVAASDVLAVSGLALKHLKAVAAWLANPEIAQ